MHLNKRSRKLPNLTPEIGLSFGSFADKKLSGKSKDEQMAEKKQELEKRLQDVTGQLGTSKKAAKKGKHSSCGFSGRFAGTRR